MSNPIVLLQEQIERAEALKQLPKNSPQYKIWCDTTTKLIRENFTDTYVDMFNRILPSSPRYSSTVDQKQKSTCKCYLKRSDAGNRVLKLSEFTDEVIRSIFSLRTSSEFTASTAAYPALHETAYTQ